MSCSLRIDHLYKNLIQAHWNVTMATHRGGCHCGAVQFEVNAPEDLEIQSCNCSICAKSAYLHLIVPASRFRLRRGSDVLVRYRFNTGAAEHLFCKVCGIKSFYVPRSNPDGYSVNLRCLDPSTIKNVRVTNFDGQNWERHGSELAHLSRDED